MNTSSSSNSFSSTSSSTTRLGIALALGICLGIMLCTSSLSFSTSSSPSSSSSSSSLSTSFISPPASPRREVEPATKQRSQVRGKNILKEQEGKKEDKKEEEEKDEPEPESSWWESSEICSSSNFDLPKIRETFRHLQKSDFGKKIFSKETLHQTARHLRFTTKILKSSKLKKCWSQILMNRKSGKNKKNKIEKSSGGGLKRKEDEGYQQQENQQQHPNLVQKPGLFFFDLGSRKLDQVSTFLSLYPQASRFTIVCFEPNPKFNSLYKQQPRRGHVNKLFHVNAAVGIVSDSLELSDRNVGSSIVREGETNKQSTSTATTTTTITSSSSNSIIVPVVPFVELLLFGEISSSSSSSPFATSSSSSFALTSLPTSFKDKIILKVDVEKVEFALLHQLIRSGAITLVSELLVECHYNTNQPREKRDPRIHIGLDDCVNLVNDLRDASGGSLEVVLWNSVKTAKQTGMGYIDRHGGFYPT